MMIELIKTLVIKGGIMSGLIAGIVASCIDHKFMDKMTKAEQTHKFDEWQIDEIRELLRDVSKIRNPAVTETNEDVIENAYHLVIADFERAKPLLYKKEDPVILKGFFNTLHGRYDQMQDIRLGHETNLTLEDSKRILIGEIEICKHKLLNTLQDKQKEIMSKLV